MESKNQIEATLSIEGMHCPMCEDHVNDKIRRVKGVKKVNSSHRKNNAIVIMEEGTPLTELSKAVSQEGYRVLGMTSKPYVKKGFFSSLLHR